MIINYRSAVSSKYNDIPMFHVYIFVQAICPGVYGGHRVRQVHEADQQSGDHPVQHERPHHAQERLLLPPLQDRGHEVHIVHE